MKDASDIDDWFTEEKERLEKRFFDSLMSGEKSTSKELFDKKYSKLLSDYQKKQISLYEHQKSMAKMMAPWRRLKVHNRLFWQRIRHHFKDRRERLKKLIFEIKYWWITKD